ncbi:DUF116 domain-containing protein [Isachenkonia alkalipeptolytica]|uniref:DUF116 domain-containing protein n=1 Tax=Isachenkonia alkalipeptolytica TaxID=2565777 RepID=A0AA43XMG2_9CLOT|nr:DUF116 domain-containing protein [Isachenkonia alkalipeptolytica]NBG89131.1 DUF116 domain-containing protein [Isachenkonia alkalipeptolytica]
MNSVKRLLTLLSVMFLIGILILAGGWALSRGASAILLGIINYGLLMGAIAFFALTFLLIYAIIMLRAEKVIPKPLKNGVRLSIRLLYPIIVGIGKPLGYDKKTIRNAYAQLNNHLILSNEYQFKGEEIMILTPHCLQKSTCGLRVTQNPDLCKRCGQCNVDDLVGLKEKYGIQLAIATGGTLARRKIMEMKPKAIIAVACERDLISGLQDVKDLPVLAIVNRRPEGPCVNTEMDIEQVELGIRHFLKE